MHSSDARGPYTCEHVSVFERILLPLQASYPAQNTMLNGSCSEYAALQQHDLKQSERWSARPASSPQSSPCAVAAEIQEVNDMKMILVGAPYRCPQAMVCNPMAKRWFNESCR
jgi:hypothetical protein